MRIGLEVFGLQSRSRHRGIGRYVKNLVAHLLTQNPQDEFILYAQEDLPTELIPTGPNAIVKFLTPIAELGESTMLDALARQARANPDRLDVLGVLNPLEMCPSRNLPARPLKHLPMVAVVYDVIPFKFRDNCLPDLQAASRFYGRLMTLRHYDGFAAISESTRQDFAFLLNLPGDRIANIRCASDPSFFFPTAETAEDQRILKSMNLTRPFVLTIGTHQEHKNLSRLIAAFGKLPEAVRLHHQLAVVGGMWEIDPKQLEDLCREHGVLDQLVITDRVSDTHLRLLYRRCTAYVSPSLYEGFGLPVLEAMHCGAAVLAGNNSSQIEVVGEAGLLADVTDADDLAHQLNRILGDPVLASQLRTNAPLHAAQFAWSDTSQRFYQLLRQVVDKPLTSRSKIALIAPSDDPPELESIARELAGFGQVALYHEAGRVPHFALGDSTFGRHNIRILPKHAEMFELSILDPFHVSDQFALPDHLRIDRPGIAIRRPHFTPVREHVG